MIDIANLTPAQAWSEYERLMHRALMLQSMIPDPKSFRDMDASESANAMASMRLVDQEFRAVEAEMQVLLEQHFPAAAAVWHKHASTKSDRKN